MSEARHELNLTRLLDAPRAALFRCWTEPHLLEQWFAPKPFTTKVFSLDLRPGGASAIVMSGPDGQEISCPGQYLEIIPNQKLAFTDAFVGDWRPRDGAPFMTAIITFEDEGKGTRYTAKVFHWTAEDKAKHEAMGFREGWGLCATQLEALAKTL